MANDDKNKSQEEIELEAVKQQAKMKELKIANKYGDKAKKRLSELDNILGFDEKLIDMSDASFLKVADWISAKRKEQIQSRNVNNGVQ